jgi:hypothetical protein
MKNQPIFKGLLALSAFAAVPLFSTTTAMADTSFNSQYQANASEEASLFQTAESTYVNSLYISQISGAVQNMNVQIANLYSAEQSLLSTLTNIPQSEFQVPSQWQNQLNQLNQERNSLLHQSQLAWNDVNKYFHGRGHHNQEYSDARATWSKIGNQVANVNKQIADLRKEINSWQSAFQNRDDSGLTSLQNSILKLQATAIDYTKDWISLEQSGQSSIPGANNSLSVPSISLTGNNNINTITVSNTNYGATVYLYNTSSGSEVASGSANLYGSTSFTNISAGSYYVIQTLNGEQSARSNIVTIANNTTLTTPIVSLSINNGVYTITASNLAYGATVYLYNASNGSEVMYSAANQNGYITFSNISTGSYYVVQYLNGVRSAPSNTMTIN